MKNRKSYVLIVFCSLASLFAFAQNPKEKTPQLGDHVFIMSPGIRGPFINTYLYMHLSYGTTKNIKYPVFETKNGRIIGLNGDVTFADAGIQYQQKFRDWMAMYFRFSTTNRLGTELQSILSQGFNTIISLEMGWMVKILEGNKNILSATLEVQNNKGNFISIKDFVLDLMDSTKTPAISNNIPVLNVNGGLRFAAAINKTTGFSMSTKMGYGETYNRRKTDFHIQMGSAIDLNFKKSYNLPVGIILSYNITSQPDFVYVANTYAQSAKLIFSYTGSYDFNLSLGYEYHWMKLLDIRDQANVRMVSFSTHYYF